MSACPSLPTFDCISLIQLGVAFQSVDIFPSLGNNEAGANGDVHARRVHAGTAGGCAAQHTGAGGGAVAAAAGADGQGGGARVDAVLPRLKGVAKGLPGASTLCRL